MESKNFIKLFPTIFLCLILNYPCQIKAADQAKSSIDLIVRVCDQEPTARRKFCIETLKANPEAATVKDSKRLAEIMVAVSQKQSTEGSAQLKTMLANPAVNKDTINQCIKYFDESVGMMSLRGLQEGTATLDVHYAYDNIGYCETVLAKGNVHMEPITSMIQKWKDGFEVTYAAVSIAENDNSDY